MSMSTRIEDLPDYLSDQMLDDRQDEQLMYNTMKNKYIPDNIQHSLQDVPVDSNIKMNVKKRVSFQDSNDESSETFDEKESLLSYLQSQINEENVLLFIVLILASRDYMDSYITRYFSVTSDLLTVVIRCVIILIMYILFKYYFLSKLRL
jgi:hypothetical protein